MIRVLAYDARESNRNSLRFGVDGVMASRACKSYSITRVLSPQDLLGIMQRFRPGFVDLIVGVMDDDPDELLDVLRTIRQENPGTRVALIGSSAEDASRAASVGASGFCLVAQGADGLSNTVGPLVTRAIERHGQTMGLRCDRGTVNVVIDEVMFAESSKKGTIVHLASDETLLVRCALQAFFECVEGYGCFAKAGNSFAINLDSVRTFGDRAVLFANGDSIIVPVRTRKQVKDDLEACWTGRQPDDEQ